MVSVLDLDLQVNKNKQQANIATQANRPVQVRESETGKKTIPHHHTYNVHFDFAARIPAQWR